nr:hypothetical protein [Tanacetum cinerariifolium]
MALLNKLMKTCANLTQKVAHLEHNKVTQVLEITKLKQRVRKIESKRRSKHSGLTRGITELDVDENVTLVDADTVVEMDANTQGRMEEDVTTIKEVKATEPRVFDDEEVTMTMAQTLIKMKAEKSKILDEQMDKRLQDEELKQAVAREKQEKDYLEKTKVLQQQYDQKQENIDWNVVVVEQMQEKHLDNIKKYQSLKRKLISVAQARKNMIVYLKNMAGSKPFIKSDRDEEHTKKRPAKETLLQESFKRLRAEVEVSEKDYPFTNQVMTLMLSSRLQVEEDSEVARDLVMKIFLKANQP